MNGILNFAFDKIKQKIEDNCSDGNVGASERVLSVISGGLILGIGVKQLFKNPISAFSGITLGSALVYRGVTGHCTVKSVIERVTEKEDVTVIEHRYFVK
ncbi:DUF2892 domain-containing protein [Sphingobacterium alkalisoli]|uniref:DUF2892 domain-containing protein n=1 Tax=Sphingobacterium alkalisoli TaxID=1874115 RepID=A0A4V5LY90_9SPHI|nr:DUF2892 domain-containing protein [Sphingobacterium alkalisoli]TJY65619.1 DUF2892 domain-containing protein [Sphingobacterium alkalisoli]GGH19380.1 hypothetical protein GCM10011418_23750 [Sphingobacterium alkalisoli]